jgi:hypothetical protein
LARQCRFARTFALGIRVNDLSAAAVYRNARCVSPFFSRPSFALLVLTLWFAGVAWERFGGEPTPLYGYLAIGGGVTFSLLIGGGLMALAFYSSRRGYDENQGKWR